MVKNYTAVQNDVNLNVSSEEFNRNESNDGMENTTESVHSIFCCGDREIIGATPKKPEIVQTG